MQAAVSVSFLFVVPEHAAITAFINTVMKDKARWNYGSMTFIEEQERHRSLGESRKSIETNVVTLPTSISHGTKKLQKSKSPKAGGHSYNFVTAGHVSKTYRRGDLREPNNTNW